MFCSLQIPILGMVVVKLLFLLNCYFVVEFFLCCLFDFFFPLINRKHVPCLFFSPSPHILFMLLLGIYQYQSLIPCITRKQLLYLGA